MTNEEARKILLTRIECEERQMSGCCIIPCDNACNTCKLLYEQGTWDEFVEALKTACKALEDHNTIITSAEEIKLECFNHKWCHDGCIFLNSNTGVCVFNGDPEKWNTEYLRKEGE